MQCWLPTYNIGYNREIIQIINFCRYKPKQKKKLARFDKKENIY